MMLLKMIGITIIFDTDQKNNNGRHCFLKDLSMQILLVPVDLFSRYLLKGETIWPCIIYHNILLPCGRSRIGG